MAKVKLPLMSGQVRGKVGGVVFSVRRGQQIARMATKPANPKTVKQTAVRDNFKGLTALFKGIGNQTLKKYNMQTNTYTDYLVENPLTAEEVQAWKNYAVQTLKKYESYARLAFISENIKRLKAGENIKRVP